MERKYERRPTSAHRRIGHRMATTDGGFICARCNRVVPSRSFGTRERNHCPFCLCSLHVDIAVGDRRSLCGGVMEPISLWRRDDGDIAIIHRCSRCGSLKSNRVAGDDDEASLRRLVTDVTASQPRR